MKDRLGELQGTSEVSAVQTSIWYDHSDDKQLIVAVNNRNEKFKHLLMTKDVLISPLSSKISLIRKDVLEVQQCTKTLREMHTTALMTLSVSQDDEAEMKRLITRGRSAGQNAAKHLAGMTLHGNFT
ncbi:Valine--tRNA ligase [Frankliniella fusca]|uniref:Valine--tRNA ligase n=1 Tax=Frankliniella fusca TaxID=407009 RepID=A0AAE1GXP0_9NEOP|nr:Valine--tRNA ligase [Frankliniella fusca]